MFSMWAKLDKNHVIQMVAGAWHFLFVFFTQFGLFAMNLSQAATATEITIVGDLSHMNQFCIVFYGMVLCVCIISCSDSGISSWRQLWQQEPHLHMGRPEWNLS